MGKLITGGMILFALIGAAQAQTTAPETAAGGHPVEYITAPVPQPGQAPTMRVTELNPNKRSFQIVFSKGDDAMQGLAEFAAKNKITVAHFTAFGALSSARLGWFDADKRVYKTITVNEPVEVTSFMGSITRNATTGLPNVHVHGSMATYRDGKVYAGHIVEARISLTMQVYLDDSAPLTTTAQAPAGR